MYQQILIENQLCYIPAIGDNANEYRFNSSTYFIRGWFSRGHYNATTLYARLGELESSRVIRCLSHFIVNNSSGLDHVFIFDASDSWDVMKMFRRLNEACMGGYVPPLPDLEFVHPAGHVLLYSLGKFSGGSVDCYLSADSNAFDLNQKIR